ncbi:hypothetical protein CFC21_101845 [Triticum aestivum]|uniref:Inositol polyphosphate-related phosphatase domain-containing protein n=4 Tax=Triticum TaxID=4564 RepID=A0A9R1BX57_TRITD|nr:type I inositol polyphosphate 5-phosphatase 10-like [Triticum dicoccoides]XP_044434172.1 type I inositol polyphosphate 5-phosphatase 10-like isoform X1 [Triticum aestivum]KAF7100316.1 hypothetical protein CFC21_101845 [Triticum aestivum]VAI84330.1 unnamed protein product [Triticum turgidum subsp. durum]
MSNIFGKKGKSFGGPDSPHSRAARVRFKSASLNCVDSPKKQNDDTCKYRVFVGTWNVGGKNPNDGLNLQDFLQVDESSDIYVLGFQEIVPLTAGNVLVLEDNEPAARWLALIHQALNHPQEQPDSDEPPQQPPEPGPADAGRQQNRRRDAMATRSSSGNLFFQTPSLKLLSTSYRVDSALVKTCNCSAEASLQRRRATEVRESVYRAAETPPASTAAEATSTSSGGWDDDGAAAATTPGQCEPSAADGGGMSYCLIASKQMVGLFLSVWVKKELVEHVGHLRVDCVGRGIMRWLGNKGCIAMSMTLHHTSLCFVCSHLASGEKEGDEVRRNADVAEILKSAHFPRACKSSAAHQRVLPERILEHDKMIWLGDLNYRVSLSYEETRTLLEENDWDALLEKDQLMIEREAGRVFGGWKEGKISFAPTYKYTQNSDAYAGETVKSKKKRRTPAWCDRILWHGEGIEQLQYLRGESRFSDHRPVWGVFAVEVEAGGGRMRNCYSMSARIGHDKPGSPQRHGGSVEPSS